MFCVGLEEWCALARTRRSHEISGVHGVALRLLGDRDSKILQLDLRNASVRSARRREEEMRTLEMIS